uniref:Uncharacterized protein n=1 Tax=Daucus carota subsp. sativus TaxID=79200 RepID=A0A166C168_DAUCS
MKLFAKIQYKAATSFTRNVHVKLSETPINYSSGFKQTKLVRQDLYLQGKHREESAAWLL